MEIPGNWQSKEVTRDQYLKSLSDVLDSGGVQKLEQQLGNAERVFINGTKKALQNNLKTEIHKAESSPKTIEGALAQNLGLSEVELRELYSEAFFTTAKTFQNRTGNPVEAAKQTMDYYSSSRAFGGKPFTMFTLESGQPCMVNKGSFFQQDLNYAIGQLALRGEQNLKVYDLGCGAGLSTLSILSTLEQARKVLAPQNKEIDYVVKGGDISSSMVDFANKGKYKEEDVKSNLYKHDDAKRMDEESHNNTVQNMINTYGAQYGIPAAKDLGERVKTMVESMNEQQISQILIPTAFDQSSEGFQVKEGLKSKVSYETIKPFDLSNVEDGSQNIISCFDTLGLLSDSGKAKVLKMALKKLKPGGYFFSDLLSHQTLQDFFEANPKCKSIVNDKFYFERNATPGGMSYFPALLCKQ